MVDSQVPAQAGLLDKVKSSLHLDKVQFSSNRFVEICMWVGLGFLIGYVLKRFSAFVLVIVLTLLGLFLLHQFEIINLSVNIDKMREFLGVQHIADVGIIPAYWSWAKENMILLLGFFIGFLIGIRLG